MTPAVTHRPNKPPRISIKKEMNVLAALPNTSITVFMVKAATSGRWTEKNPCQFTHCRAHVCLATNTRKLWAEVGAGHSRGELIPTTALRPFARMPSQLCAGPAGDPGSPYCHSGDSSSMSFSQFNLICRMLSKMQITYLSLPWAQGMRLCSGTWRALPCVSLSLPGHCSIWGA